MTNIRGVLSREIAFILSILFHQISTAGTRDLTHRWPNGNVIYEIASSASHEARLHIKEAMAAWSSATCITFTPRADESSYVRITTDKSGCYSDYIGFLGRMQVINLQEKKCTSVGIAIHELGHVLGLWHEQSRPDRDKYVKILTKNIRAGKMKDFARRKRYEIDTHGLAYDYDSIMHYRLKAFSKMDGILFKWLTDNCIEPQVRQIWDRGTI